MAKIQESYDAHLKKFTDNEIAQSGYFRACGDIDIARALKAAQATVIRNGNELENLIFDISTHHTKKEKGKYDGSPLPDDRLFVKYKINKKYLAGNKGSEIDIVMFTPKTIYVCELKDGDNFDTKKSSGEVDKLNLSCEFFKEKDHLSREVAPLIVLWNCNDLKQSSFKDSRARTWLTTGRDFAPLINVDYDGLNLIREEDQLENNKYILNLLKEITEESQQ